MARGCLKASRTTWSAFLGFFFPVTSELIDKWAVAISQAATIPDDFKDYPDGGTCNNDTVTIYFGGWKQCDISKLTNKCGVAIGDKLTSKWWKGSRFIWFDYKGSASRRTAIAEACCTILVAAGIPASIYYQMD